MGHSIFCRAGASFARRALLCTVLAGGAWASSITSIVDTTNHWNVVPYRTPVDCANDQRTGKGDGDIVGTVENPGFYSNFDGTYVYYRVRLGATNIDNRSNPVYSGMFSIGIDGNRDGALDLFLSIDNQAGNHHLQFQDAGPNTNDSLATTTVRKVQPQYRIAENGTNFNYAFVSSALQPGITSINLNGDRYTDAFLSFRVPFSGAAGTATLQGAMQSLAGIALSVQTPLAYVIGTSTGGTPLLNEDIGGIDNRRFVSTQTWRQSGGLSAAVHIDGTHAPEPGPGLLALTGLLLLVAAKVFRRRGR
jgi:hypothetical protein